jgi:hypothetical protein
VQSASRRPMRRAVGASTAVDDPAYPRCRRGINVGVETVTRAAPGCLRSTKKRDDKTSDAAGTWTQDRAHRSWKTADGFPPAPLAILAGLMWEDRERIALAHRRDVRRYSLPPTQGRAADWLSDASIGNAGAGSFLSPAELVSRRRLRTMSP